MALATTCPQCKTSFKVVPDQLKLRRGMVRCGVCQHVFSGIDFLRYVDESTRRTELPADALPEADRPVPGLITHARGQVPPSGDARTPHAGDIPGLPAKSARGEYAYNLDQNTDSGHTDLKTAFFLPETVFRASTQIAPHMADSAAQLPESLQRRRTPVDIATASPATTPDAAAAARAGTVSGDAAPPFSTGTLPSPAGMLPVITPLPALPAGVSPEQLDNIESLSRVDLDEATDPSRLGGSHETGPAAAPGDDGQPDAAQLTDRIDEPPPRQRVPTHIGGDDDDAIDYFSPASQARGFASPLTPFGWVACGLLLILLAVQGVIGLAPRLFQQFPQMPAPLAALLAPWRTSAELPRDLKSLSIESFELAASPTPGVLSMSAVLRNEADHGVRWPALELTLTDGNGGLLARKVILAADYLKGVSSGAAARDGLLPHAELPVRLALQARDLMPAGYSVTLFYP